MDNVQKDVQDFHALHPNRKLAVLGIVSFVFIVAVVIGMMMSGNGPTSDAPEQGSDQTAGAGETVLAITPVSPTIAVGESTVVNVMLDVAPAQAVDIVVNFDPAVVSVSDVVNGDVYPDILRNDVSDNQIIVSAAVDPSAPNDTKTGTVFSFTVTGVSAGQTELSFDPALTITARSGVNTLGNIESATISVQ